MNYRLKDMKLSVDSVFDAELHRMLESLSEEINEQDTDVYDDKLPAYTPFGRALFGLLLEATNQHNTSKDYLVEKIGLMFDAV